MGDAILVGDIGGTNARFAILKNGTLPLQSIGYRKTADYPHLHDAIHSYLSKEAHGETPVKACIAVACPAHEDTITFTNNNWSFSARELQKVLGLSELHIINDFTAQALAIPHLAEEDIHPVGPEVPAA
ncbi:MAG: glucokinase, partial [Rickettsiales bacterium]